MPISRCVGGFVRRNCGGTCLYANPCDVPDNRHFAATLFRQPPPTPPENACKACTASDTLHPNKTAPPFIAQEGRIATRFSPTKIDPTCSVREATAVMRQFVVGGAGGVDFLTFRQR